MNRELSHTARLDDAMIGAALLAGAANVIMQLSRPEVGYGVVESRVDSGNLFRHPVKRTRTTLTYLAVAALGTEEEKRHYREAVNKQHAQVRSTGSSPVRYNAFDPDLQLWVAACLYKGLEDVYRVFGGSADPDYLEALFRDSAAFGTTLQVPEERWPADRAAFEEYWNRALSEVSIDDTVRSYLYAVASARFLPRFLSYPLGPFNRFITTGFLPQHFRNEMRLQWTRRDQKRFDRIIALLAVVVRASPRPLRQFPYNALMWDLRYRIRTGRPLA